MVWETVIGLEVHVQLATQSKIFSGSSTAFGAQANTQASAIDLAMPGTLPVANEQAFRFATMFGLAINADIGKRSVFERKNYFYPDLPKGYQTTQLAEPIVNGGYLDIDLANGEQKRIRIHHAHLEEDAGKSLHEDYHGMSGIDLNRAGTPLIEVVSEPDMSSKEEAVAFARKLHSIVTSLGICDGEMSQGSMRFDVNISVRQPGDALGTRTETKNLNSFRFMERCIEQEVERQIDLLEQGGKVDQETRLYDGDSHTAKSMRSKEEANDYRYFPCPDLLPVILDDDYINEIRASLPELPDAMKARFEKDYALSAYDAGILTSDSHTASFYESVVAACEDPKLSANWVMGELSARLNSEELTIKESNVSAQQLGKLIARIKDQTLTSKLGRQVFDYLWDGAQDVDTIIEEKGLKPTDAGELESIVDQVLADNPQQVENYRNADDVKRKKMIGFFVGQIMKASKGQANPQQLNPILKNKLES
ncbi:Asp-tRNA(Asn)/Glu-tRNA(Gln) amidotransferase subunit GatB [Agarilytica rhodophyticola]|uniref:Asp-tRNA(Asn)/Glu-tRNA(Gln) amidotransferase subunit GatB n=1 Tax=Agarilytica rhodophyticola TaxID=1737490 RepID=UPI000B3433AC|nr:Asp-tRNA(Asn)/Glu-tRNA(Gln) amidotransferase subunit GatB [Agarilytica rhodophyticola]